MRPSLLFLPLLLAACNSGIGTDLTREAARATVRPVLADRFPGVPLEPATDCIIDNATGEEIITLAGAAATRNDQTAARVVGDIARRPATIQCIATQGLPVLLDTL
ncbi:hypothetical protein [Jannaschia sp. M317]|uniref:hypothetical protein n=1 Tax=Jannaschia sp. M317 TaxID=2867011 RepID=UPI0021A8E44B|nr:hypothetical protein [Jannaschia sp. M317]UWQ18011.1 hypothetical protein K3551_01505 [Jannaschia sp. M317]